MKPWQRVPRSGLRLGSTTEPTACGRWWSTCRMGARSPPACSTTRAVKRASCSTAGIPIWPGRIRPTTSRASTGRCEGRSSGGQEATGFQAGERRRHRRRHDRFDADPGRSRRHAAGAASRRFQKNLAAHAWLWKDHTSYAEAAEITQRAGRRSDGYLDQVRRLVQQRVVLVEDPALQASRPEGVCRRLLLGRTGRFHPGLHHRQPRSRHDAARHLRGRAQGDVSRAVGRAARQAVSRRASIPGWRRCATTTPTRPCVPIRRRAS